jgi:hypothetical protein
VNHSGFSGWKNYRLEGDNVGIHEKRGDKLSIIR